MGGLKENAIEAAAEDFMDDDFMEHLGTNDLTEDQVRDLRDQTVCNDIDLLVGRMMKSLDRWKYYAEPVDMDEFDYLKRELERIRVTMTL